MTNEYKKYFNHVKDIKINHESFALGTEVLERAYELKQHGHSEAYAVAIMGESRVGKTTLINNFLKKYKSIETETRRISKCVLITVPVNPTTGSLCEAILYGLGDNFFNKRDNESIKRHRVIELMKKTGVKVLILDEMQHFVGRWSSKGSHDAADSLKVIIDATEALLIIAGLEYGRSLLHQNESFRGRVKQYISLTRFDWNDTKSREQFRGLLKAIATAMSPFELPDISSSDLAYRFYLSSGGLMGYVVNIIESAMHNAIFNKRFQITIEDFIRAHETSSMERKQEISNNPFNFKVNNSIIDQLEVKAKNIGTVLEMEPPRRNARKSNKNQLIGIL